MFISVPVSFWGFCFVFFKFIIIFYYFMLGHVPYTCLISSLYNLIKK